jgi:drug/metabolite transporter (DMT)-like permease
MTLLLFIIAILDFWRSNKSFIWAQASLMDFWTLIYQTSVGPTCFVLISEISSTRLRSKTIAIATAVQAFASIGTLVAMPYMLNSDQANWRGKAGYLFGGVSAACFAWCWSRLPETRGRTFEEIDVLFERKVPALEFGSYDLLLDREGDGEERLV